MRNIYLKNRVHGQLQLEKSGRGRDGSCGVEGFRCSCSADEQATVETRFIEFSRELSIATTIDRVSTPSGR